MPADVSFIVTGGALHGPLFGALLQEAPPGLEHLLPGTLLGPFRLMQRIGAGGSGLVFRAERCADFEQIVAIKAVRARDDLRERFRLERGFLGRLEHPGIVRIIDGGESADGVLWSAMEFIDGLPIDVYCDQQGLEGLARINLVASVCNALQYAHQHLVVHGDIKPSNLLVDSAGRPRLLDFGISSQYTDASGAETGHGFTPGFASPEQEAGQRLTLASDIFQLGRLLAVLVSPAVSLAPLVRRNLDALIARATAARPEQRVESVAELRNDLLRVVAGLPCHAEPWNWRDRTRFALRRAWRTALGASLALLVVLGMAGYYAVRIRAERDRAELEARSARVTSDFLQNMFRIATPAGGRSPSVVEVLDQSGRQLMGLIATAPLDRAILVDTLARANLDLFRVEQASEILGRYDDAVLFDASVPAALQARLLVSQARVAIYAGQIQTAERKLERAQPLVLQARPRDASSLRLSVARVRAQIARSAGQVDTARMLLETALHDRGSAPDLELAGALADIASIYSISDRTPAAIDTMRQSTDIYAQLLGASAPIALEMQRRLAFYLAVDNQIAEAERLLDQQEQLIRSSFGPTSMEYAALLDKRGVIAFSRTHYAEAIAHFRSELQLLRRNGVDQTSESGSTRHNLASALALTGQIKESIFWLREALQVRLKSLTDREQVVLVNRFDLSQALCMDGQWQESERLFVATLALYRDAIGTGLSGETRFISERAQCLTDAGQTLQAGNLLTREIPAAQWEKLSTPARVALRALFAAAGAEPPSAAR